MDPSEPIWIMEQKTRQVPVMIDPSLLSYSSMKATEFPENPRLGVETLGDQPLTAPSPDQGIFFHNGDTLNRSLVNESQDRQH